MTIDLNDRIWFSTEQAAEYANCHPATVRKALQAGELPGGQRKPGGRWSIHKSDIDAWKRGEAA